MPETIEAKEHPLIEIFSDRFRFRVPYYQRPYAWKTEETAELLDDLKNAASAVMSEKGDVKVKDASPYFLGSIVIVKGDSSGVDIVDGQQRITTLTILFSVLRDLAHQDNNAMSAMTIHNYIRAQSDEYAGITGDFRLSVRDLDKKFFQSNVQEIGKVENFIEHPPQEKLSDSQVHMLENTKYLWGQLSELDENQRKVLTSFLVRRCYIVVVSASDRSSAYRIFSVLNGRGLDLTTTDILKAEIIGGIDTNLQIQDRYNKMWEDYEENIGRESFESLFSHVRMICTKTKLRKAIHDEFRQDILPITTHQGFMDDVLTPYYDQYKTITDASYEGASGAETVNVFLRHLNRLDNFDWIPPAMAFFERNSHDTASLVQFTRALDRLAYGLFIMRSNINERIRRYAELLHAIESTATLSDSTGPLQLTDSEKEQILQALDGPVYRKGSPVPLILLRRLDSALADKGASYDLSVISVEHVLPQSPDAGSEWIRNFPDQEERERWTHKLANLVLLSRRKNARAANYDFGRKKDEYFQQNNVTPFVLTTRVVNESEWTPEVLGRRQRDLIEVLKKEWSLG